MLAYRTLVHWRDGLSGEVNLFVYASMGVIYLSLCTGLVKAKKYDWKDSNLALFGSDTEKQVKSKSKVLFHQLGINLTLVVF